MTVIDPTGDFARAAANIVPIGLTQRVLYFDPSDMAHPAGLNVLENVPKDARQPLTETICSYFEAMWPNGWGAQSNYILANCLRVLLDTPRSTLLGVLKLLTNKTYRTECLRNCNDPVVKENWRVIGAWDKKQELAAIAPLQNKIGTLLMSPTTRNIVGQEKSTLKGADIIIANLDRAKIGDLTAHLLGGLLIARSSGQVYINDFPFFAFEHFSSLFPQNRFSVSLSFLDELPRKLQNAVLTIDEKIVLKTNPDDAGRLGFYVNVSKPDNIIDLELHQARVPYSDRPIEADPPEPLHRLKALQKRTRAVHTRPRKKVEKAIEEALE